MLAAFPRVLLSTGGIALLRFVAIPLADLRPLELRHRWLMQVFVSFAGPGGRCWPSLALLAEEAGEHLSWVRRNVQEALDRGYITRQPRRGGGYTYTIAERFLPVRGKPVLVPSVDAGVPTVSAGVPMAGTEEHLEENLEEASEREGINRVPYADDPCRKLSLSQDEIPSGWEEAAAAERRLAGLAPVNLACEWRKLVAYSEGQPVTIWRWRGWVLKARCDGTAAKNLMGIKVSGDTESTMVDRALPGDESQQRHARDWVRSGFWLRNGAWGPAPDQPGCTLPAGLVRWCLRERAAAA